MFIACCFGGSLVVFVPLAFSQDGLVPHLHCTALSTLTWKPNQSSKHIRTKQPISCFSRECSCRPRVIDCNYCNSYCWTAQSTRCLMSVSVDSPEFGHFDIPLTASSTAADIILLLRERLPDCPWHGNKLLSSGVCQLQCDDVVEATPHSTLVLANNSEITNQETHLPLCSFFW